MQDEVISDCVGDAIRNNEGDYHSNTLGEYHPSSISGCPLGELIDWMTEETVPLNNHIFNGKCVHYWLQETGVLSEALHDAGYHWIETDYEVSATHEVEQGVELVGRADVVCNDGDEKAIIDIKYSSLKSHYNSGRLYKYATQVNTYAGMFGADKWALLLVYSKADSVPDEISMMSNEFKPENFETVQQKAVNVHNALKDYGWHEGNRWTVEELKQKDRGFWEGVMEHFSEDNVPFYDGELKYSDRDEWVLPYMDEWDNPDGGGLSSFKS